MVATVSSGCSSYLGADRKMFGVRIQKVADPYILHPQIIIAISIFVNFEAVF